MPRVYAAVKALIENKGKYLILEQEYQGKKILDLPGGKIDYNETPYDALIREVKEETCLEIEVVKPVGVWRFVRLSDNDQVV